jgi:iron complex transport system substrate-binding protein
MSSRNLPSAMLSRRQFGVGAFGVGVAALLAACSSEADGTTAEEAATRSVTTPLGTYDIPVDPKRVVAIDGRIDLELAVALGLPVIGYNLNEAQPWVPVDPSVPFLGRKPNVEEILGMQPDLVICLDWDSEYWPTKELQSIAPVLPTDGTADWRTNLEQLAGWLDRTDDGKRIIADYEGEIAEIRERNADVIATKTVASLSFSAEQSLLYVSSLPVSPLSGKTAQQPTDMTLGDLGGRTLSPEGFTAEGELGLEQMEKLQGVDGFMLSIDSPDSEDYKALAANSLWQRLPAVQAGNITFLAGDTYYGSNYTGSYVARGWDELYTTLG